MKIYLFGRHRKKYSNNITVLQAKKELTKGWGYIISNGEIVGMGEED